MDKTGFRYTQNEEKKRCIRFPLVIADAPTSWRISCTYIVLILCWYIILCTIRTLVVRPLKSVCIL